MAEVPIYEIREYEEEDRVEVIDVQQVLFILCFFLWGVVHVVFFFFSLLDNGSAWSISRRFQKAIWRSNRRRKDE